MGHVRARRSDGIVTTLRQVRRAYRNWISVSWTSAIGLNPKYVELRDGRRIAFGNPPNVPRGLAIQWLPRLLEAGWTIERIDETHARLAHAGDHLQFTCRFLGTWSDILPLTEVFVDKVYAGDLRGKVVLDVGMADGDSAVFFARNGAARVIGVEPLPETYALSLQNLRQNGVEGIVIPLQGAVASGAGSIEIRVASLVPNRSSAAPERDQTQVEFDRSISVRTFDLPELMSAGGVEHVDLVKMDCEGAEYAFLRSLTDRDFARIDRFAIEYHDGPRDLVEILRSHGFNTTFRGDPIGLLDAQRSAEPA